jgi:hypothetical protein
MTTVRLLKCLDSSPRLSLAISRASTRKWLPEKIRQLVLVLLTLATAHGDVNPPEIIAGSSRCVVKLFGAGAGNLDSYGSGTLISEDGHVVTVWNHLINTGYLTAVTSDGRRFQLDVVGTSAAHDLAVLKLNATDGQRFPCIEPPRRSPMSAVPCERSAICFMLLPGMNRFRSSTGSLLSKQNWRQDSVDGNCH